MIKILVEEEGSERAAALWSDASVLVSGRLLHVETHAASRERSSAGASLASSGTPPSQTSSGCGINDDLPVESWRLVGEEGNGLRHLLHGLNPERILLAGEAVGIGEAAVPDATEREVFGRPIGANQAISHPLALARILHAAWLQTMEAAWRYDHGQDCGTQANSANYLAAEAAFRAADTAVQTQGGMGYATDYHVERYWREARIQRLAPVSQEMTLIPRCIAKRYAHRMPQLVTRIDDALAAAVDQLIDAGVAESRSDAVRLGLHVLVDRHRRDAVGTAIVAGYQRIPQIDDDAAWASSATARMIAEEPW